MESQRLVCAAMTVAGLMGAAAPLGAIERDPAWLAFCASHVFRHGHKVVAPPLRLASLRPVPGAVSPCPRPAAGSAVEPPPELSSAGGVLNVDFHYKTTTDADGRTLFCFVTPDGIQSPTLRIDPGDSLNIALTNDVPLPPGAAPGLIGGAPAATVPCGATAMNSSSVNMHFHGTNVAPKCHGDEVIHTIVNSGEKFVYRLKFPKNEPPGLYWYHPHIHGMAEAAVQGGASGVIVVNGIETLQPAVAGLPERILVVRDQIVAPGLPPADDEPAWDISLNYVPVAFPANIKPVMAVSAAGQEFWRVANASADTVLDLKLLFDGVAQPLKIVALDGVPVGSQDGTRTGTLIEQRHILVPTAGRAEFIVPVPPAGVKRAVLVTSNIQTGPDGDYDPPRVLAVLKAGGPATAALPSMPVPSRLAVPAAQRFEGLATAPVSATRSLYFSEVISNPADPSSPTNFFITVDGATPTLFDPANPPAIVTRQGAVEEWTIENRTGEVHEFHLHQIHFQLVARNGVPVPARGRQFLDTIQVPYWNGSGAYPSVTLRMDFRGMDVGDFVYHCHILGHEDAGMMAVIRVLPRA